MSLFDLKIEAVRPLPAPTGLIFYTRFRYSSNRQSRKQEQIEKDVEAFYNQRLPAYRDIDDVWYAYASEGSV